MHTQGKIQVGDAALATLPPAVKTLDVSDCVGARGGTQVTALRARGVTVILYYHPPQCVLLTHVVININTNPRRYNV